VSRLTVVVADDHYLVREGLTRLLGDGDDVEVVGDAASATELVDGVGRLRPATVLTDIRMPPHDGMDGVTAALDVRRRWPGTGVVVLSQHADASYARALFAAGTDGLAYLLKERVGDRDELVRALRAVAGGGSVVDPLVVDALLAAQRRAQRSPLRDLTERELAVLRLMAGGHTNPAVARSLHVSESAVSKHVAAIFAKLGLAESRDLDRRVAAVLAYVTHHGPAD
jgi:DNA-binding NarL/FixJ family response regulator